MRKITRILVTLVLLLILTLWSVPVTFAQSTDGAQIKITQVADVEATPTATALEAALLEVEEIHRLDPPYNVQLRAAERRAWFASRDYDDVVDAPDPVHRIGPLPSRRAVAGLAAMTKLLAGSEPSADLRAAAVGAPAVYAPERELFDEVWAAFAPRIPLLVAGQALHRLPEEEGQDEPEQVWTPDRARRHLVRTLAGGHRRDRPAAGDVDDTRRVVPHVRNDQRARRRRQRGR